MHVVVGASGPLGSAVVEALVDAGHSVRGINRSGRGDFPADVEIVAADVRDIEAATSACAGADIIYQCASAPYTDWTAAGEPRRLRWTDESTHLPRITAGVIAAARSAGARIVYADNFYMYGPVDGILVETIPWLADDSKGAVRADVARALLAADDIGVAIGCASDFFGPRVLNSTVGDRLFQAAVRGEATSILGAPDTLHSYSYIRDVAAALVALGADTAADGQVWHLPCQPAVTRRRFYELAYEAAGTEATIEVADDETRRRHGYEAHLMDRPFLVDDTKFRNHFAAEPTPLPLAIAETVAWFRQREGT